MTQHAKPTVLAIDDQPDATQAYFDAADLDGINVHVTHPQDVTDAMLAEADLVLVDYQIDDWPERTGQPISMAPANGLALAVILREHADSAAAKSRGSPRPRPSAFALHSGHLGRILGRLREQPKPHLIAKLNNLEWAFSKDDDDRYLGMQRLATAVREMPDPWPKAAATVANAIRAMLALKREAPSYERCWQDVLASRAPVDVLTREGHSTVPLRWLLHQVLPYPTFLWAEHWVAARLGLTISSFRELIEGDSRLKQDLEDVRYSGLLSDFLGPRWWKGALEDYVWELVDGRPSASRLRDAVDERAGKKLEHTDGVSSVVCLGTDLKPTTIASPDEAVRIDPDHWPSFADSAWIRHSLLEEDPTLVSLVDPMDRPDLDNTGLTE